MPRRRRHRGMWSGRCLLPAPYRRTVRRSVRGCVKSCRWKTDRADRRPGGARIPGRVARRSASTPVVTTAAAGTTGGTPVEAFKVVAVRLVAVGGVVVEGAEALQREGTSSVFLAHRFREAHRVDGAPHLAREGFLPDAKENFPPPRPLWESVGIKP